MIEHLNKTVWNRDNLVFLILLLHDSGLHLSRHDSHNFSLDFIQLNLHLAQDIVDGSFVVLVDLGNSEGCDPGEDEESHCVEPGADVSQAPEGKSKLDSVNHVINQKQPAQLAKATIEFFCKSCGKLGYFITGDSHFHSCDAGEGVATRLSLLHHYHDIAVQFDSEDNGKKAEGEVCDHRDEGVVADRDQSYQH